MKNKIIVVLLFLILFAAAFLRFYRLAEVPPSITWDEASVGYNAWAILNWGKDEWGKTLPLVFKSFGEYKNPIDVYLTVPAIAIFGLNEFGVRASSAFFGVLNVLLIYFLGAKIFKNKWAGVISALVLAISPYNLHFSRFNHELNFTIFFFMLGLYLFLKSLEKRPRLLIFSFLSFGVSLLSYNAAKIVVPATLSLLITLYIKDLLRIKKHFLGGILVILFFAGLIFIEPNLLGIRRLEETSSQEDRKVENIIQKYKVHFSFDYLFVKGDPNARLSSQVAGEFYKTDLPFLVLGTVALIWFLVKNKRKEFLVVAVWALLAPIPATITSEIPHAARAMFMTGSWHLILAFGVWKVITFIKRKLWVLSATITFLVLITYSFIPYVKSYYSIFPKRYAIEWQYGMKQIVDYVKKNDKSYYAFYMTDIRSQPYIFYLFYLKYPLPQFLKTVKYNETIQRPSNLVVSFDKYKFGIWDPIESMPEKGTLYIVGPSHYTGLRHKALFRVVKAINYPNGTDAFYLVTSGQ